MKKSKFAIDDFEIVEEFKYCKNCHTKNTKKAKFCFECGSKDFVDSLEPKNTNALEKLATFRDSIGDYTGALEYLEKLLQLQPDSVHARALKKLLLQKYIV